MPGIHLCLKTPDSGPECCQDPSPSCPGLPWDCGFISPPCGQILYAAAQSTTSKFMSSSFSHKEEMCPLVPSLKTSATGLEVPCLGQGPCWVLQRRTEGGHSSPLGILLRGKERQSSMLPRQVAQVSCSQMLLTTFTMALLTVEKAGLSRGFG